MNAQVRPSSAYCLRTFVIESLSGYKVAPSGAIGMDVSFIYRCFVLISAL